MHYVACTSASTRAARPKSRSGSVDLTQWRLDEAGNRCKRVLHSIIGGRWETERRGIEHVEGTAFLHHMVRRIVALLVAVGRKQRSLSDFETAFRGADVKYALPPAPPQGLTLEAVTYVTDAAAE